MASTTSTVPSGFLVPAAHPFVRGPRAFARLPECRGSVAQSARSRFYRERLSLDGEKRPAVWGRAGAWGALVHRRLRCVPPPHPHVRRRHRSRRDTTIPPGKRAGLHEKDGGAATPHAGSGSAKEAHAMNTRTVRRRLVLVLAPLVFAMFAATSSAFA